MLQKLKTKWLHYQLSPPAWIDAVSSQEISSQLGLLGNSVAPATLVVMHDCTVPYLSLCFFSHRYAPMNADKLLFYLFWHDAMGSEGLHLTVATMMFFFLIFQLHDHELYKLLHKVPIHEHSCTQSTLRQRMSLACHYCFYVLKQCPCFRRYEYFKTYSHSEL